MTAPQEADPARWLEEHGDYLFRYALVRVGSRTVAEDLVQETFLAGLNALDRYDGRRPVRFWLRGILSHKVVDHFRRAAREAPLEQDESGELTDSLLYRVTGVPTVHPAPWSFNPRRVFERKEFMDHLYDCLAGLPAGLRRAFTLRELEDEPTETICKELGVTANNVWVMLHRARGQLKACLEKKWNPTQE